MSRKVWIFVIWSGIAFGQQALTLEQALASATANHPVLAAMRERIVAARGAQRQAGLRPNPRLNLQTENTRIPRGTPPFLFWRDTDNFAFLQQTFETAGKRARRLDVAGIALRRSELELELERRRVVSRVRQAYWAAAGAQKMVELLEANLRTFQQVVEYHGSPGAGGQHGGERSAARAPRG